MFVALLLVIAGLAALYQGGNALVMGASTVARRFGVSSLVVGLTVVAFGTSAPELAVNVIAALEGTPGIAMGNVLGSNIFNILIVVGLVSFVAPISVQPTLFRREIPLTAALTLLVIAFSATGSQITRWEGGVLVALLLGFVTMVVVQAMSLARRVLDDAEEDEPDPIDRDTLAARLTAAAALVAGLFALGEGGLLLRVALAGAALGTWLIVGRAAAAPGTLGPALGGIALGLVMLVLGSDALVEGCTVVAQSFGISDAVIGLTVVAVGTSAPELATSLQAARRGEDDIAVGNALGSNIFNLLCVLGLASLILPLDVDARFLAFDAWVALGATLLLFPALLTSSRVDRRLGVVYVGAWLAYTAWLVVQEVSAAA